MSDVLNPPPDTGPGRRNMVRPVAGAGLAAVEFLTVVKGH